MISRTCKFALRLVEAVQKDVKIIRKNHQNMFKIHHQKTAKLQSTLCKSSKKRRNNTRQMLEIVDFHEKSRNLCVQNGIAPLATDQKRTQNDRRRRERTLGFYGGAVNRYTIYFSAEAVLWMWWNREILRRREAALLKYFTATSLLRLQILKRNIATSLLRLHCHHQTDVPIWHMRGLRRALFPQTTPPCASLTPSESLHRRSSTREPRVEKLQ